MQLRRFAFVAIVLGVIPACSAIVNPDTTRLGGGPDTGQGGTDGGVQIDTGVDGGGGGMCTGGCDDMIPCTVDSCDTASSTCRHMPNHAMCGPGMRCSPTRGCITNSCTTAADCSDGDMCNGAETCAPGTAGADPTTGCVHGVMLDCNDHVDCTNDACHAATGCAHELNNAACSDTFACTTDTCTLTGCNHATSDAMCNAGCFSGASCVVGAGCIGGTPTMCMPDGNFCTADPSMCDVASGMCLHPLHDNDGDGHGNAHVMSGGTIINCPGGDDCDDNNAAIHPGATELCNGVDDNCNGVIDESGCLPGGPETCASEMQIAVNASGVGAVMGSNTTLMDDYTPICGHTGGRDAVYDVQIPGGVFAGAVDVTFSTDSPMTTFDTVLAASVGSCGPFNSNRMCNDDIAVGTNNRSRLTVCVSGGIVAGGTSVHVLVDGFDGAPSSIGNYRLNVMVTPHAGVCP